MGTTVFSGISNFKKMKYTGSVTIKRGELKDSDRRPFVVIEIRDLRHPGDVCRVKMCKGQLMEAILGKPACKCLLHWDKDFVGNKLYHDANDKLAQQQLEYEELMLLSDNDGGGEDCSGIPDGVLVSIEVDENDPRLPVNKIKPYRFVSNKVGDEGPAQQGSVETGQQATT